MGPKRIDVHRMIRDKVSEVITDSQDDHHVYFQPPASVSLKYPCVVYQLQEMPFFYANNKPYHWKHVYQLTVIDRDPESALREKIAELSTCHFVRAFVADNLHHYVFEITC